MHSNGGIGVQESQIGHNTSVRELNSNKASFNDIYNEDTPLGYYKTLSALGYGDYHDQVTQLINESEHNLRSGVRKVIDIGCLYGSSAISYAQGAMWSQSLHPEPIRNPEITAVDISDRCYSPEALGLTVKWSKSVVLRHRFLTDAEVKANGGVTTSFVRVYIVEF
ncbi:hypothetical protein NLG97_g3421 [Lecanicillium saksenae]|uniref:Uncharacterized protein n=1 Tax=Lecanicillium saksenae TaxID=468837 RepID=A0ACC1QYP9_9HYPO|nr:hypothetical protein NLG97_g3421 [Lecanicillium saksenae]